MYLEAGIANGHPIVNTIMATIRKNDLAVSRKLNPVLNKQQTELDHLIKALGISGIHNTEEIYQPITDTVKRADSVRSKRRWYP
jgi:hypothetical protein